MFKGRSESKLDLVGDTCLAPMAFRSRSDLLVDFARDDSTVCFHRQRDCERAVTRIGADLKIAPNAEEACEQRHELRLFRRNHHVGPRERSCLFANELQRLRFAKADLHEVLVKQIG